MTQVESLAALVAGMTVVDLSQMLEEDMPVVPSHPRFFHGLWDSPATGSAASAYQLVLSEHTGTHVDATAHFIPAGDSIDETDIGQFYGRAVTLDVSFCGAGDAVSGDRLESIGGDIRHGDIVLFRFGWDRFWKPRSVSNEYATDAPIIDADAARWLVRRGVKAVGSDTMSLDGGRAPGAPVHNTLLGNGVNLIENLTNLDQIIGESFVVIAPLKVRAGTGGPARAIAFRTAYRAADTGSAP